MTENLLPGIELVNCDCAAVLPGLPPAGLILTSPPYDDMREYGGYNGAFDFDAIAAACVANLAPGGVLVWVVADQLVDGGETGTSFRQALGFMGLGLKMHQPLIFSKWNVTGVRKNAYFRCHEYMFVFAKGAPRVVNLLKDKPSIQSGRRHHLWGGGGKVGDKHFPKREATKIHTVQETSRRGSIWDYGVASSQPEIASDLPGAELHAHPADSRWRLPVTTS